MLSRKGVRDAATQRELEDAFQAGIAVEGKVEKAVKGGYEVRIARERAFCPLSQIDIVADGRSGGARGPGLRVPRHRVQGRREKPRRLPAPAPRGAAARQRRRCAQVDRARARFSPDGSHRCRRSVPSWTLAAASRACSMCPKWAGRASPTPTRSSRPAIRSPSRCCEWTRRRGKISLGLKQLLDDPWTTGSRDVRGRSGAHRPCHPRGGLRRVRRARARCRRRWRTPRRLRRRAAGGWAKPVPPGSTGAFEILSIDPAQKRIGVALIDDMSSRAAGASAAADAFTQGASSPAKVERHEPFGVFVFLVARPHGADSFRRNGTGSRCRHAEGLPDRK